MGARLTTTEAADRLGIKPETLYAYVSRGLVERTRGPGGSTFDERDIERLAATSRRSKQLPAMVFPSSLTLIEDGRFWYRGVDVVQASSHRRFEEVAEWLWCGRWPEEVRWPFDPTSLDAVVAAQADIGPRSLPLDRFRITAAVGATLDSHRHDATPDAVAVTGRRLLRLLVHGLPRVDGREARRAEPTRSVAEVLWTRLTALPRTPERLAVLDAALVLLADHELASSTLAVRMAAMVRADPYEVVGTGLNVIGGSRHGGASLELESALHDAARVGVGRALDARLRGGGRLHGFGHALYPDGDPRARVLVARLADLHPAPERHQVIEDLLHAVAHRDGHGPPNVDAALAALSFAAEMRPGAGEAIFALARTAGWIAHAIEQYERPTFVRGRVDYVGRRPDPDVTS